jgi:regulatory protein
VRNAACGIRNYPSQPSPSRGEGGQNVFSPLRGEDQGKGERGNTAALVQNSDTYEKELSRAMDSAYRCLTYRPRSRAEVEAKLRDKGFDGAIIQSAVSALLRLGYLDDEKFARLWAESRIRLRAFGKRRIERELRTKGVDPEIVRETLSGVFADDQEIDIAERAAARKIQSMSSLDRETQRRRLAGFLERKGFPYDVIRVVLQKID